MAQIRRPPRYRSPPPRQIPSLPHPIRIQLPTRIKIRTIPPNDSNNTEQSLLSITSSTTNPYPNNHLVEESIILPPLSLDNDDEHFEKKHLPVIEINKGSDFNDQINSNSSQRLQRQSQQKEIRLPQPMEINIEDNIHKLRLRLIDSELKHQRRSTDEYIKRTHRIGMDNDLPKSSDIDRQLEMRRTQESINQLRRSNEKLTTPNHSYDSRLHHLQPLNEEQIYVSSNMEDLIDSMARRHLAYRRLDVTIDRQRRRGNHIEGLNTGRTSFRAYTERDYVLTKPNDFNQKLRSRIDYYNRIQPDSNGMGHDDSIQSNSYRKLPPISSERDSNHLNSLNSPEALEHLMSLPRTGHSSPQSHRSPRRAISKDGTERSDYNGFFTESINPQRKKSKIHRNAFRKAAIGILFFITLKHRSIQNRANRPKQSPSATIHKIRLQEIIVASHRVYIEPDGPIFNILMQAISSPISFDAALNSSAKNHLEAINAIGNALKNLISKMTEFMPKDGVLGTAKTSAISALIQDGNSFPENYFWQCERKLLAFDGLKVVNITKQRAILLLIGIFIFRALITTLLVKPIKYRLILGQLKANQSVNLKILASVILYLGRRVAGSKSQILPLPNEWRLSFYSDSDIRAIIHHTEMKSIIDTCEHSLRLWCEEYIRRIDGNVGKEIRH